MIIEHHPNNDSIGLMDEMNRTIYRQSINRDHDHDQLDSLEALPGISSAPAPVPN